MYSVFSIVCMYRYYWDECTAIITIKSIEFQGLDMTFNVANLLPMPTVTINCQSKYVEKHFVSLHLI
jgi:hypothetical protein